jgi:hypothetical protein
MKDDFHKYKWVISVRFSKNHAMYYSAIDFSLKHDPRDATRYKTETSPNIEDDKKYACSQGGESSTILLEDAIELVERSASHA